MIRIWLRAQGVEIFFFFPILVRLRCQLGESLVSDIKEKMVAQGSINTVGEFFKKTTQARGQSQRSTGKLYIIWVDFRRITICGQTTKISQHTTPGR